MRRLSSSRWASDLLVVGAVAMVGCSIAAIGLTFVRVHPLLWNDGCGDDGASYCAMAHGQLAPVPLSHRILYPLLLRLLTLGGGSVVDTARVITPLTVIAVGALAALVTLRLGQRFHIPQRRLRTAAVIAGCMPVLMPYGFHFAFFYPVFTDPLGLAFGLGWVLAVTSERRWLYWSAPALALLACLTREEYVLLIGVACVFQGVMCRSRRTLTMTGITMVAVAVGAAIVFSAPSQGDVYGRPLLSFVRYIIFDYWLGSSRGFELLGILLLFGVGLFPVLVIAVRRQAWSVLRTDLGRERSIVAPLLGFVAVAAVTAPLGFNVDKNIDVALLFAAPVILVALAQSSSRFDFVAVISVAATVALWRPFTSLDGTRGPFLDIWGIFVTPQSTVRQRLIADYTLAGVALALVLLVGGYKAFVRRPRTQRTVAS